ncbi:class I SAM-dependent methyltransferase [Embleya sp. AB8]|uniref:class I SAM-dependent methyltransferase n=1 Tax=Embleya sp. AB8 TaxID=3156304 RepID=UPI003C76D8A1
MSIPTRFLRHPLRTGAIAASSAHLADALTEPLTLGLADVIVELGPGTGVVTEFVLRRMRPGARFVAIELDPVLADSLRTRFAGRRVEVLTAPAAALPDLVDAPVDAVVSGLPWTCMSRPDRYATLNAIGAALAEHGAFTTFAYGHAAWTPPARELTGRLAEQFTHVTRSPLIWRNTPPAFVHYASHPRRNVRGRRPDDGMDETAGTDGTDGTDGRIEARTLTPEA